jgi:hypothetical protein
VHNSMLLETLLKKVELFYKLAVGNHYPVDTSKIQNILDIYENFNDQGDRSETVEYAIVPLSEIEKKPIWAPEKLEAVKRQLEEGKSLEPISLIRTPEKPGQLLINDGIHRTEASRQIGYTHIPALIHTYH